MAAWSPGGTDPSTARHAAGAGRSSSPLRTPDTYAQDPGIAAALMLANGSADQSQADQAASSPALQRMSTPPASSSAPSSLTTAGDVWVTVPVDKVSVAKGKGTVTPLYAAGAGYVTPAQGAEIPPATAVGR